MKVRFPATLGEEPEVEVALVAITRSGSAMDSHAKGASSRVRYPQATPKEQKKYAIWGMHCSSPSCSRFVPSAS